MTAPEWPEVPPTLTDGVVTVRPWREDDAEAVHRACQDPEIQRWARVPSPYLPEHARRLVGEPSRRRWRDRSAAAFAVVDARTDAVLGAVGLVAVDTAALVGELGFWVAPWGRRRGVARRSARLLASWALSAGGLIRVELLVRPENLASRAVARSIGAQPRGVLRGRGVLDDGGRYDLALYVLLA